MAYIILSLVGLSELFFLPMHRSFPNDIQKGVHVRRSHGHACIVLNAKIKVSKVGFLPLANIHTKLYITKT